MGPTKFNRDEGFALVAVLTAIALITVIAIAGFTVSREALNTSTRDSREARAYTAASTGLDSTLASFSDTDLSWPKERTLNGGDTYSVVKNVIGASDYELVSTGRSAETTEVVRVRFQYFDLWDMNIAGSDNSQVGSGAGFNGNGTIIGKVYCNGNFDWTGSAELLGGPVFVKNGLFNRQSTGNQIGTSTDPVSMYLDHDPAGVTFDQTTGKVIATREGSPPKLEIPWPTDADMNNYQAAAQAQALAKPYTSATLPPNTTSVSTTGTPYYKVLVGDTTIGGTPFGNPGIAGDDFALGADGTLWLNGTVYCTGTLTIGANVHKYHGSGILVAKNGIVINGQFVPDGYVAGDPNYLDAITYPGEILPKVTTTNCIGLITEGSVTMNGSGWNMVGAVFSTGPFVAPATGAKFRGSIIAGGIDFQQPNDWMVTQPGLKEAAVLAGMPSFEGLRADGDWVRQ